jgi:hypothetical protein
METCAIVGEPADPGRLVRRPVIAVAADAPRRPNIVIILGDDMGYSDMGSFGSEINTPNLDSLAKDGVRFTGFYTHASCSPTRTRDFTEHFWAALDGSWYTGGQASVNGVTGEKLNNLGFGFTVGYQINDNLDLTCGYKSTVNDGAPGDLRMDRLWSRLYTDGTRSWKAPNA